MAKRRGRVHVQFIIIVWRLPKARRGRVCCAIHHHHEWQVALSYVTVRRKPPFARESVLVAARALLRRRVDRAPKRDRGRGGRRGLLAHAALALAEAHRLVALVALLAVVEEVTRARVKELAGRAGLRRATLAAPRRRRRVQPLLEAAPVAI